VEVFSFERKRPTQLNPLHFIYGDAWAEFDRLESRREKNAVSWVQYLVGLFITAVIPLSGIVLSKRHVWMIGIAWFFLILLDLGYKLLLRSRFINWQCPRCGTKWPGTAKEKDRACRVCALQLHQLS
jgi:hypothetical protein